MALNFNKMAADGNQFIHELAKQLGDPDDTKRAGRILKSTLQALRDRLTIEESVQVLAQLPMFLKAVYVDNWNLRAERERIKHLEEFFEKIKNIHGPIYSKDFHSNEEVEQAIITVFMLLRKYISLGELEDIRSVLPKELKTLFNSILMI